MFNWLGNKLKYVYKIRELVGDCELVVDPMMGSGNVLVELVDEYQVMGNDIVPLIPIIYNNFDFFNIEVETFQEVDEKNNWFRKKEDYYKFRDYWNTKYSLDTVEKTFLVETYMLLKMCSNSMIRFNRKGLFNQGFRGIKRGNFFIDKQFQKYSDELKRIRRRIKNGNSSFSNMDVVNFLDNYDFVFENTFFIFDPPYMLLSNGVYSDVEYNKKKEQFIFDFIIKNELNFVFFNYLERDGKKHNLDTFIKRENFEVEVLNEKTCTGQNRQGTKKVKEILITNRR